MFYKTTKKNMYPINNDMKNSKRFAQGVNTVCAGTSEPIGMAIFP